MPRTKSSSTERPFVGSLTPCSSFMTFPSLRPCRILTQGRRRKTYSCRPHHGHRRRAACAKFPPFSARCVGETTRQIRIFFLPPQPCRFPPRACASHLRRFILSRANAYGAHVF